jgi:hypothetical protein
MSAIVFETDGKLPEASVNWFANMGSQVPPALAVANTM